MIGVAFIEKIINTKTNVFNLEKMLLHVPQCKSDKLITQKDLSSQAWISVISIYRECTLYVQIRKCMYLCTYFYGDGAIV